MFDVGLFATSFVAGLFGATFPRFTLILIAGLCGLWYWEISA